MKRARLKELSAGMVLFIQWEDRLETWFAGLLLHPHISRTNGTGDNYFSSHSGSGSSPQAEREIMKQHTVMGAKILNGS